MKRACAAAGALLVLGCSVPKEAGFPDVARDVEQRIGHRIFWNQGGEADAAVAAVVRAALKHPLAPDEAVQIALLENPKLQATYEELTVTQADLVQAGLLSNPTFTGALHLPVSKGTGRPHIQAGVEEDFLDVFMIPAKRKVRKAAFEAAKRRVAGAVLDLAYDVRAAYFTLQGATQIAAMRDRVLEAAEASVDVARRQHEAGNISDFDLVNEENVHAQIRLDAARARGDVVVARERLTRLLGLFGGDAAYRIDERLPALPPSEPDLRHLESLAIRRRLDVAAARQDLQTALYDLEMATDFRWVSSFSAGAEFERDIEGGNELGPTASISLPIFDQKQAALAKLAAIVRMSEERYRAAAIDARSEVREARAKLELARSLADDYRTSVIPMRERAVALAQEQYNAMLLGVYQLIQVKQAEVNAYRDYIEATRDYWIARAELGRAIGGRLPGGSR
ncbi:MAG TPA: TolC family protein [Minicystis sp.]|nr:TolC family protein [Minicystis sp.]